MFLIIGVLFFTTTPPPFLQQMSNHVVLDSIGVTFGSSFIASLIVFVLSIPTAYVLSRKTFWGKRVLETVVVDLPLSFPAGIEGLILLLLLSRTAILGKTPRTFSYLCTLYLCGCGFGQILCKHSPS